MSRRVFGCGRGALAGVCVMRLEVGGGEDARGRFVQNRCYKFASHVSPGLGGSYKLANL